jgi:serine/threonine protein phosphatase PrpC
MEKKAKDFSWVGSERSFVDEPNLHQVGPIIVGRFGGNSHTGQYKNEDACLVWVNEDEDWEFVMVLDAHNTAESAKLAVDEVEKNESHIKDFLKAPLTFSYFRNLEERILSIFQNEEFREACRKVQGETACMIVARKGKFVWWLSIGDCVLYLFHQELAAMGQFQLNQRHFYEWVGQVNTFDLPVPCFSSGIKELRKGENRLLVTTDGLIECPGEPYSDPQNLAEVITDNPHSAAIESLLKTIQEKGVRDSTTIVSWKVNMREKATMPSG